MAGLARRRQDTRAVTLIERTRGGAQKYGGSDIEWSLAAYGPDLFLYVKSRAGIR